MGNKFDDVKVTAYFTKSAYYKLYAPEIFKQYNKLIWLEPDTITRVDLKEFYNLQMKGNLILGHIDLSIWEQKIYGIKSSLYINGGVLLMDLKGLREFDFVKKSLEVINHFELLRCMEQSVMNIVLVGKVGPLPAKYGIYGWYKEKNEVLDTIKEIKDFGKDNLSYDMIEFIEAYNNPCIIHYTGAKPWTKNYRGNFLYYYIYYATKTDFGKNLIEKWYFEKLLYKQINHPPMYSLIL